MSKKAAIQTPHIATTRRQPIRKEFLPVLLYFKTPRPSSPPALPPFCPWPGTLGGSGARCRRHLPALQLPPSFAERSGEDALKWHFCGLPFSLPSACNCCCCCSCCSCVLFLCVVVVVVLAGVITPEYSINNSCTILCGRDNNYKVQRGPCRESRPLQAKHAHRNLAPGRLHRVSNRLLRASGCAVRRTDRGRRLLSIILGDKVRVLLGRCRCFLLYIFCLFLPVRSLLVRATNVCPTGSRVIHFYRIIFWETSNYSTVHWSPIHAVATTMRCSQAASVFCHKHIQRLLARG